MISHRKLSGFPQKEINELFLLWNHHYPLSVQYPTLQDFERYLHGLDQLTHIFLQSEEGKIHGWYFEFTRQESRWFGIIISENVQGQGNGKKLLNLAQESAHELNGWVIDQDNHPKADGTLYQSPLAFYLKQGFHLLEDRLENDKISCARIRWRSQE